MAKRESSSPKLDALLGSRKKKRKEKGAGTKKYDRNRVKCARYRYRVGKPHREGNKRGKNKLS